MEIERLIKVIKLKNIIGFGVFLATNIVIFYSYPLINSTGSTEKINITL